jgi:hypothetical protein
MTKISRAESERLSRVVESILQLPVQLHIGNESVICHIFCGTQDFKNKRFEIVMGLNDPEPSETIRHMAQHGQLTCLWEGHAFQQGPEFYPDENETGLESFEVPDYDTYLSFYVETE